MRLYTLGPGDLDQRHLDNFDGCAEDGHVGEYRIVYKEVVACGKKLNMTIAFQKRGRVYKRKGWQECSPLGLRAQLPLG